MGDEVSASWINVFPSSPSSTSPNRVFQRVEIYSEPPESNVGNTFVAAPFGGNILNLHDGFVLVQKASGKRNLKYSNIPNCPPLIAQFLF